MKKLLLILLILALPLQAIAAMERSLAHVLGNGQKAESFIKHMIEHDDHVLHHHDEDDVDDDTPHVDGSQKSVQHLADYEHGGNMTMLLPALGEQSLPAVERIVAVIRPDVFSNRTTIPLLRPPRTPV